MEIGILNQHVMRIIIGARDMDSINSISKRIKLSYGWTYKWVKKLIGLGVFKTKGLRLILNKNNKFYRNTLNYIRRNFSKDLSFNYSVLSLFGIDYCFTKTDSVFIWTKGGYNIARSKDFYPIFIKIKRDGLDRLKWYCRKLGLKINAKAGIFYNLEVLDDFKVDYSDDIPVDSLDETIKFMKKYIYNFEPALEMVSEMYNRKDLNVKYKEVKYV